ncbi:orotidine-5'-phosphate decarboxylase [Bacteroidota bacterium]
MTSKEKLLFKTSRNFHICVGLDTDINKIPSKFLKSQDPVFEFNKAVIDSTSEYAAAYKLNLAFYEKVEKSNYETLHKTIDYIPDQFLVIGDGKKGDIGNTMQKYAQLIYKEYKFDACTLNPLMGYDSINPFLDYSDKLNFVISLTSNIGSSDFEKLKMADGSFLFQLIIKKVSEWDKNNNLAIVFGATKIDELRENIPLFKNLSVLLPGVGTQGGNLEEVVRLFLKNNKEDYLINISRSLIYCDNSYEFEKVLSNKIEDYHTQILNIKR